MKTITALFATLLVTSVSSAQPLFDYKKPFTEEQLAIIALGDRDNDYPPVQNSQLSFDYKKPFTQEQLAVIAQGDRDDNSSDFSNLISKASNLKK